MLLYLQPQAVYYNCVKFHEYQCICEEGIALTKQMESQDRWTNRVIVLYVIHLFVDGLTNKASILT